MPPPNNPNSLPCIPLSSSSGASPDTMRATLVGMGPTSDEINWANMGLSSNTLLDFKPTTRHPPYASAKTNKNKAVLVTHPLDLIYFATGQGGWRGRFKSQQGVLFTNELPPDEVDETWKESIIIHLPFGIRGAGVQYDIKPRDRDASTSFTAHMVSRHKGWTKFMETQGDGSISPGQPSGSAVFVGLASPTPAADFVTLELWVTSGNGQQLDFAINQVSLIY